MSDGIPSPAELRERAESAPQELSVETIRTAAVAEDWDTVRAAADALVTVGEAASERLPALLDAVASRLDGAGPKERNRGTTVLRDVAAEHPEAVTATVPALADRLDDEYPPVRVVAADALALAAAEDPDAVAPVADALGGALRSDHPEARRAGLSVARELAMAVPAALAPAVGALVSVVERPPGDSSDVGLRGPRDRTPKQLVDHDEASSARRFREREQATQALMEVVTADPGAFTGTDATTVDPPARKLATVAVRPDDRAIRKPILEVLAALAEAEPWALAPAVKPLSEFLAAGDADLRSLALAAHALGFAAVDGSVAATVAPAVPTLGTLAESEDADHRGAAVGLLAAVADYCPVAVAPLIGCCVDLLDPSEPWFVRANAARTLGQVGTVDGAGQPEDVLGALRRTMQTDPNDDVRSAASDALERLSDRHD